MCVCAHFGPGDQKGGNGEEWGKPVFKKRCGSRIGWLGGERRERLSYGSKTERRRSRRGIKTGKLQVSGGSRRDGGIVLSLGGGRGPVSPSLSLCQRATRQRTSPA